MRRLLNFFRRGRRERDLDAELRAYLDELIDEKRRTGMPPDEAARAARIEFGGLTQVKELVRESYVGAWTDPLWQDVRCGLRMLGRNRGFTAVTVLTLALGIGANTALFSVTRAFLLRELPYTDPDRLFNVYEVWPREPPFQASGARAVSPDFVNWRARGQLLSGLEAYSGGDNAVTLTGVGDPERVQSSRITAGLLGLLGVRPMLGRSFSAQEDRLGGPPAAILGYSLWKRRFGESSAIIGRAIVLDGLTSTVVGVLPASFVFPDNSIRAEIFVPMALPAEHNWHDENNFRIIRVLARLKPSVAPAALQSELGAIVRSAAPEEPPQFVTMRQGMQILVAPLRDRLVGDIRPLLLILQAVVGMVLVIGCLNIANLQIARAISREKEMALRAALGAARIRIARQLLTESLLLGCLGGAAGLLLGLGVLGYVRTLLPSNLHLATTVQMDATVLVFTLALAVSSGIVTGLAPSLAFSTKHPEAVLKRANIRAGESKQHHRVRGALVVAEIAIAMILLAGAGLLTRSFLRLTTVDLGFDPHGVLTVRIPLADQRYPSPQARVAFFSQLLDRSRSIPGVQAVAFGAGLPLIGSPGGTGVVVDGRPLPPIGGAPVIPTTPVSPDYFHTLRIPLVRGRAFTPSDRYGTPLVLIVNEAFASEFFPGEEVLGRRLRFSGVRPGPPREIVGVVGNVRQEGLQKADVPIMYAPFLQIPNSEMLLILRSGLPPEALTADARRIIQRLDPDQPVADVASMDERINGALGAQRANVILMAIFAGLALSLATSGIFGVVAYLVTRRSHEMGIRLALGAQPADVLKLVFQQGMRWAIAGIGLGIAGALLGARSIRNLLYETSAHDPLTLVIVSGIFGFIATAACYLPARHASRIDPVITLRQE